VDQAHCLSDYLYGLESCAFRAGGVVAEGSGESGTGDGIGRGDRRDYVKERVGRRIGNEDVRGEE
jgi:hypothetical protein